MIYPKDCPKGIDIWIGRLQDDLFCSLLEKWCIKESDYNCFARAYRNRKDKGYVPEISGQKDFLDVLLDDKVKCSSFFGMAQTATLTGKAQTSNVHVVFFVNLEALKLDDEQARQDVANILRLELHQFSLKSMATGVERALEEYTISDEKDKLAFDSYPWHCFRYNLEITFDPHTR